MRSLAQWSRASEVWFSKRSGPRKGHAKKEAEEEEPPPGLESLLGLFSLVSCVYETICVYRYDPLYVIICE